MIADTAQLIRQQIADHPIILYMKGTPAFPRCGYSAQVVAILKELEAAFTAIDVLDNPAIRATLPSIADWPTFPQLWVNGELIGGADIVNQLYQQGSLKLTLAATAD